MRRQWLEIRKIKTLYVETLREHGLKQTNENEREECTERNAVYGSPSEYLVTLTHAVLALCHLAEGKVTKPKKHTKIAHKTNPKLIPTPDPVIAKRKVNSNYIRLFKFYRVVS